MVVMVQRWPITLVRAYSDNDSSGPKVTNNNNSSSASNSKASCSSKMPKLGPKAVGVASSDSNSEFKRPNLVPGSQ